jgi:hypothetical protein
MAKKYFLSGIPLEKCWPTGVATQGTSLRPNDQKFIFMSGSFLKNNWPLEAATRRPCLRISGQKCFQTKNIFSSEIHE